jgi:hypothetical protein
VPYKEFAIAWHVCYGFTVFFAHLFRRQWLPYLLIVGLYLPASLWWLGTLQSWKTFALASVVFLPRLLWERSATLLPFSFFVAIALSLASIAIEPVSDSQSMYEAGIAVKVLGGAAFFIAFYASIPIAFAASGQPRQLFQILRFAAGGGLVLALYSIAQQVLHATIGFVQPIAYSNERFGFGAAKVGGTLLYRSAGLFVEPKTLCTQLALAAFAVNMLPWSLRNRIAAFGILLAGSLATMSTGGMVGLVALGLVLLPLVHLRSSLRALQRHLDVVLLVLLLCGLALGYSIVHEPGSIERAVWGAVTERGIDRLQSDGREQNLLANWWQSSNGLHKIFGSGYAAYVFAVQDTANGYYITNSGGIRMLVETGLVGVIAWLTWALHYLRRSSRCRTPFECNLNRTVFAACLYATIADSHNAAVFIGLACACMAYGCRRNRELQPLRTVPQGMLPARVPSPALDATVI